MKSAKCKVQNKKCKVQIASCITLFLLLVLSLSGCGSGGGGSSQVIEGPPSAPTGVNVVVSGSSELVISWNSVVNTNSYNIYWSNSSGVSKVNGKKLSGITSTNYVHSGLINSTTYYYVVTAVNSYGESSESAEVYATLAVPRPPGAVAAVAGDGQVTVTWSVDGATSYNLYMASQSGVSKANYTTLTDGMVHSSSAGTYTHTGLVNGKTYYFVVTSINSFGESSESNEVSATPASSSGLTVSGSVKYEDKEYGKWQNGAGQWIAGFTGKTTYKAVRFAELQAVDSADGTTIIASGTTDASGSYTMTIPSATTMYIRVISSASTPSVGVKDLSNAFHAVAGPNFTVSGAAMANISIPTTSQAAGAFNILDVFTSGAQFVQSLSGSYPSALTTFWQTGSNGTWYCSGGGDPSCPKGEGIYVLNGSDSDEYDDDVLWHEYGHFIANKYSKDDSPGGAHYLTSNDLDLRLSWSEGWGDFFPGAVKAWLNATSPSLLSTEPAMPASVYVDTSSGGGWSFDIGNSSGAPFIYSSSEVAVANILWRVMNETTSKMSGIWDVFSSYIPSYSYPVTLEAFWDGWLTRQSSNGSLETIFSSRAIFYKLDSYETDINPSSARKATIGQAEEHTLYGSGDIDYIAFDASIGQKYTVKTAGLNNGADTFIRVIAPDQSSQIAYNDNTSGVNYTVPFNCDMNTGECHENGGDLLGSTATFTASSTGTYYVEVKSSPNRPLSAGRYGGYSLKITSP